MQSDFRIVGTTAAGEQVPLLCDAAGQLIVDGLGDPGPAGPPGADGFGKVLTQADYDAIPVKDPDQLYMIKKSGTEEVAGVLPYFVAYYEGATMKWKDGRLLPGGGWKGRLIAEKINCAAVCWSPERSLFVAVAFTGFNSRVMTSPDGLTWSARYTPVDNNWRGVCWSPELSLFVAVANSGIGDRVMTSPDGINWTAQSSAVDNSWLGICWSPEQAVFVAVADYGSELRVMTGR
jgi:hypothetical protein